MARRCNLTAKGVLSGNKVSHSNRKTRRRFLPNIVNVTLRSEALNKQVSLRVSANALRSVDHNGGLDAFLLGTTDSKLSEEALKLKKLVKKATKAKAA